VLYDLFDLFSPPFRHICTPWKSEFLTCASVMCSWTGLCCRHPKNEGKTSWIHFARMIFWNRLKWSDLRQIEAFLSMFDTILHAPGNITRCSLHNASQVDPPWATEGYIWPVCMHSEARIKCMLIFAIPENGGRRKLSTRSIVPNVILIHLRSRIERHIFLDSESTRHSLFGIPWKTLLRCVPLQVCV